MIINTFQIGIFNIMYIIGHLGHFEGLAGVGAKPLVPSRSSNNMHGHPPVSERARGVV